VASFTYVGDTIVSVEQLNLGGREAPDGEPLLVNAVRAAELLSISPRTLASLTKRGVIPHRRLSCRVLYSPVELREWIASGCNAVRRDSSQSDAN
jgi:hypothetical protein